MRPIQRYRPSGNFVWAKLPVGLLVGALVAVAVAALDAVLNRWNVVGFIPLEVFGVHVGELGSLAYWAATLFGVFIAGTLANSFAVCRNRWVSMALGMAIGAIALYAHWAILGALVGGGLVLPHQLFGLQHALIADGWTTLGILDAPKTNWIFWAVEAVGFLGMGTFGAAWSASEPFCENCQSWADVETESNISLAVAPDTLVSTLEHGDIEGLSQWVDHDENVSAEFQRYRFTTKRCPTCDQVNVVEVESIDIVI